MKMLDTNVYLPDQCSVKIGEATFAVTSPKNMKVREYVAYQKMEAEKPTNDDEIAQMESLARRLAYMFDDVRTALRENAESDALARRADFLTDNVEADMMIKIYLWLLTGEVEEPEKKAEGDAGNVTAAPAPLTSESESAASA